MLRYEFGPWSTMPYENIVRRSTNKRGLDRNVLVTEAGDYVFLTAWGTMIKSYHSMLIDRVLVFCSRKHKSNALKWAIFGSLRACH